MDQVRDRICRLALAMCTEEAYCGWIGRFTRGNAMCHPREMEAREVEVLLTLLATNHQVENEGQSALSRNRLCIRAQHSAAVGSDRASIALIHAKASMLHIDAYCTLLESKQLRRRSRLHRELTRSDSPAQERLQRVVELPRMRDVAAVRRAVD